MPRILIAASGTGGHLFPARYVAQELLKLNADTKILFIGSGRPLEAEILDKAGFQRIVIPLVGLKNKGPIGLAKFLWLLPSALYKNLRVMLDFKPQVVLGVGGYVSVLPVILGRIFGARCWVHEAEKKPGLANKFLAKICNGITKSHQETTFSASARTVYTGHPVRADILNIAADKRNISKNIFKPANLLILGGSQGAQALDRMLEDLLPLIKELDFKVWHQARAESLDRLRELYKTHQIEAKLESFIEDMPQAYKFADIIIGRSGAGAVREIAVVNIPCILVPLPLGGHENEQFLNAKVLADAGKGYNVKQGDLQEFSKALRSLSDAETYKAMKERDFPVKDLDASRTIAKLLLGEINAP